MIAKFCKANFSIELTETVISVRGWNWGETAVEGNVLQFSVDDTQAFEIPLSEVAQARVHLQHSRHRPLRGPE